VCYYGTVLVTTTVFSSVGSTSNDHARLLNDGERYYNSTLVESAESSFVASSSSSAYTFDYGAVAASASAEIAGTTLVLLTVDRIGRVPSQAAAYALGGISVFLLCWTASGSAEPSRTALVLAAFCARLFFMAATCTTWVSTAEIFPTHLRTTGHGTCNAVGRLGGAASPLLLINVFGAFNNGNQGGDPSPSPQSLRGTGIALLVVSLTTAWSTWHLPETAGRAMGRRSAEPCYSSRGDGVFYDGSGEREISHANLASPAVERPVSEFPVD
jgi:hypothetical protein